LSADLFSVQQSWFLIVVNYYSKFPFVKKLHNLTTGAIVNEMKMLFAENGIPESPKMQRNKRRHKSSPTGSTNNAPEFQHTITG